MSEAPHIEGGILVEASLLELPLTGMGRALVGLYRGCAAVAPALRVTGLMRRTPTAGAPFPTRRVPLTSRLHPGIWRRTVLPAYATLCQPAVVHYPWRGGIVRPAGRTKVAFTLHDVIPLLLPSLYFADGAQEARFRRNLERDLQRCDLVLTVSECSRRDIRKCFPSAPDPLVVYDAPGLPDMPGRLPEGVASGEYYLYVGGDDPRKGLDVLIPAYRRLAAGGDVRVPLVVAGSVGRLSPQLAGDVGALRAEGRLVTPGYVSDADLVALLGGARALIYPSRYEGFGLPPLEAMAQGCPVVTTRAGALPEACGDAALYAEPGDAETLCDAVLQVERDAALRESLRACGLEQAGRFTWERSARAYLDGLGHLLSARE